MMSPMTGTGSSNVCGRNNWLTLQRRDKRIIDTGCSVENETLRFCFVDKKDWRLCKAEMAAFRECWDKHGNASRTSQTDV
ncbi:hypothetical protein BZA05DRAFT_404405 [Tricharina praecox]|uniref:uncharacterized protein n=1 Tax=Tricharina praecox TaxID=43433 RepID=UPI00221F7CA3|nr:uncharacterized protein BZA05DRAFT_404405 [Tricharina praecox]KAI5848088.1 hypothetical protein BZA05DRAFT_404405 [Tricharina praecox]